MRYLALQSLFVMAREHPVRCRWEEQFKPSLLQLVDSMSDEDAGEGRKEGGRILEDEVINRI